ncbi:hypothetical protein MF271_04500 [Deinococcus sp. KNUC1210]|uniref:hypothetical protein n=1 Tax=Deinococcus sp. KNUC1210 TaxID=2917691 RepID=UPI001EEFDD21|nr:hypothetical protein [Deinococcus sp. KNUC1210]ULH15895.1 hypothetical protein MF271_04500 [Deinococcus sp. KNUC1210]
MLDTLTSLSWPYLLALFALAAQWLLSVWRGAKQSQRPVLAWLAAPGLAALLAAPLVLGGEPLFGLGAALLLIATYAATAYRAAPAQAQASGARPRALTVVLLLLLLGGMLEGLHAPGWVWALWAGAFLAGLAGWLSVMGQPRRPLAPPGFALRFGGYAAPSWPDLELRVEGDRAWIQNIGSTSLHLAGWSFSGENAWIRPQDNQGRPLHLLAKGSRAQLTPWPAGTLGVRVWYVRQADPGKPLVFRADWKPLDHPQRVLN